MRGMGHQGLKKKLQASEDLLAEERYNWRVACENENKKMFVCGPRIQILRRSLVSADHQQGSGSGWQGRRNSRTEPSISNSILNATELDKALAALKMVVLAAGHRARYLEYAIHVEEVLRQHFGSRNCSAGEGAEDELRMAEDNYNSISTPVVDIITEALKHEDYVAHLKSFFELPETVELSDEEDDANDAEGAK
ncbi:hypothetical protein Hanom_Chr11g01022181 [Helianthus anomalus]